MATYKELKAQAEALLRQAEEARRAEVAAVIAEIKAKMKEYELTAADLGLGDKKAKAQSAVPVKYRNPATGETWSGRGRAPRWLAEELTKGRAKEDFLVG